jgi:hypothetical protein
MSAERIWFPKDPDGLFDAADRARLAIGYGNIPVNAAISSSGAARAVHEESRPSKAVMP